MKYIDEVDIELVNQELNFHTNDNSLVIKGACDIFTTKPTNSDKKLYGVIGKHLQEMIVNNERTQKERKDSLNSLHEGSPILNDIVSRSRKGSVHVPRETSSERRDSTATINTNDTSMDSIEESPFGSLKTSKTKWTFANLITILNTTFPDHDFANLQPTTENFNKLNNIEDFVHKFNNIMVSLGKSEESINWVWDRIDSYMDFIPKGSPVVSPVSSRRYSNSGSISDTCQVFEFLPSDQSIIEDINYPYQTMWSHYWFIHNKKKKKVAFVYLTAINKVHYSTLNGNRKVSFRSSKRMDRSELINPDDMLDDSMDIYDEEALIDEDSDIDDIEL